MRKRQIEVFTAGCQVCEPAVVLVKEMACPDCEVTVHDLHHAGYEQAMKYGIQTIPAVVVNGTLVSCCATPGPTREELAQAGIGQPL